MRFRPRQAGNAWSDMCVCVCVWVAMWPMACGLQLRGGKLLKWKLVVWFEGFWERVLMEVRRGRCCGLMVSERSDTLWAGSR